MANELAVRITTVGHASRRWKGAKNATQADLLNQQLSEQRAQNVRKAVEVIIKKELPTLKIEVPSAGVGSHEPFPTASENNAGVDRSVLVMVDLTTTTSTFKSRSHPPQRVHVRSKVWILKVVSMTAGNGIGVKIIYLRVIVRNRLSGREITLAGFLAGGDFNPSPGNLFGFDDKTDPSQLGKPIGDEVTFNTTEALDFNDWIGTNKGQMARLVHSEIRSGLTKTNATFLQFTEMDTQPGSLVFELKKFGFGVSWPNLDIYSVTGKLALEGGNPGDTVEIPVPDDVIPTQVTTQNADGLLVSFATGKASLDDLTSKDRALLTEFVTNKAHQIAVLSRSFDVSPPHP